MVVIFHWFREILRRFVANYGLSAWITTIRIFTWSDRRIQIIHNTKTIVFVNIVKKIGSIGKYLQRKAAALMTGRHHDSCDYNSEIQQMERK